MPQPADARRAPDRSDFWFFAALAAVLLLIIGASARQAVTGDEPRYLMYATEFWRHGDFDMSLNDWKAVYFAASGLSPTELLPESADGTPFNGVYLPSLLAPLAGAFGMPGLRGAAMTAGLIGLWRLLRLNRRATEAGPARIAAAVAALSIPLLPYLHLFYMEAFLFALVSAAWSRLQEPDRSPRSCILTASLILAVPFVHLRGSVVAALLYGLMLRRVWMSGRRTAAAALAAAAACALALLIALNLAVYGSVAGPVNTARPPTPDEWFDVISMQLFNVRHGLLAYAPVWLLGYAGLVTGSLRGSAAARQGLALAAVAAVTGVGINPGECWPARFWVLSIPMLSLGLALWCGAAKSLLLRCLTAALIAATAADTAVFVLRPNSFLENRQSPTTFGLIYDSIGHVFPGLMLPVENSDPADAAVAHWLTLAAAGFVASMCLAVTRRGRVFGALGAMMAAAAVDLTRVSAVPPTGYRVTAVPSRLEIELDQPFSDGYLWFGPSWQTWNQPPDWRNFTVAVAGRGREPVRTLRAADQVVAARCAGGVAEIVVETAPTDVAGEPRDLAAAAAASLSVFRSTSVLRSLLTEQRTAC